MVSAASDGSLASVTNIACLHKEDIMLHVQFQFTLSVWVLCGNVTNVTNATNAPPPPHQPLVKLARRQDEKRQG
jgi:hypothetical protein